MAGEAIEGEAEAAPRKGLGGDGLLGGDGVGGAGEGEAVDLNSGVVQRIELFDDGDGLSGLCGAAGELE